MHKFFKVIAILVIIYTFYHITSSRKIAYNKAAMIESNITTESQNNIDPATIDISDEVDEEGHVFCDHPHHDEEVEAAEETPIPDNNEGN